MKKQGDKVHVISLDIEAIVIGSEINTTGTWYYLYHLNGSAVWNEERGCNYFTEEELDYTATQKLHFQYEADLHTSMIQAENEYHYYNR